MCVETGRPNIIVMFWKNEAAVSLLGIHKLETNIYIKFSSATH